MSTPNRQVSRVSTAKRGFWQGVLEGFLKRRGLLGLYRLGQGGPLRDDGWLRSFEEQYPVDGDGNPIPFITYAAWQFLSRRVVPEMTVFEYGSGASTLWWSKRVRQVFSAEHNQEWHTRIAHQVPPNVHIYLASIGDKETYPRLALKPQMLFSVIVIDGRLRVRCAFQAVDALKADGVILWDNTERPYYQPGTDFLTARGFRRLDFVGMQPGLNEKLQTSIFYRPANCLGI